MIQNLLQLNTLYNYVNIMYESILQLQKLTNYFNSFLIKLKAIYIYIKNFIIETVKSL
jgi:hypothetical protein